MNKEADSFNRLRIASPCPVGWQQMKGNEQVRFCAECQLNVYNLSGMTRKQAAEVVHQTEGRICARFYRRADGTILTRDCPVGLRVLRRRAVKIAGAAATALMSFCLTAMGQTKSTVCETDSSKQPVKITKRKGVAQDSFATISGTLTDAAGAVVPNVKVELIKEGTENHFTAVSDQDGNFYFRLLDNGSYTLKIAPLNGLMGYQRAQISVRNGEAARLDLKLEFDETTALIGIVAAPTLIDTTTPGGTTTITGDMIRSLPYED
jgi:hypothetical protein